MTDSLVSVVIPVHNSATTVGQTIVSALGQSWTPLELVVVDDGSTDDSAAIIANFASPRLRFIRQANAGAANARNAGYRASAGDFIQFLDADDLLDPKKIERQLQRLDQAGHDCVACCVWQAFEHRPGDAKRVAEPCWQDGAPIDWLMLARGGGGKMPTGAWLTPRVLIEKAGLWDEALPGNSDDDGEFFSRVVLASRRVLFCGDAIYHYRNAACDRQNVRIPRSDRAVQSLLTTEKLYEQRLLAAEDSLRARQTAAHGYATFLEQVYPAFPDYCAEAFAAIERLGVSKYPPPGSRDFAFAVRRLGLTRALSMREQLRKLFGRPILSGVKRQTLSGAL